MDRIKQLSDFDLAQERWVNELTKAINQGTYPSNGSKFGLEGQAFYDAIAAEYDRRNLDVIYKQKERYPELIEAWKKE